MPVVTPFDPGGRRPSSVLSSFARTSFSRALAMRSKCFTMSGAIITLYTPFQLAPTSSLVSWKGLSMVIRISSGSKFAVASSAFRISSPRPSLSSSKVS